MSFKVAHELRVNENDPKLADSSRSSRTACSSTAAASSTSGLAVPAATGAARDISARSPKSRKVWALANGFDEILVKTKNRFYEMRTLAQLHFDVIRFVQHHYDSGESRFSRRASPPARHRLAPQPPVGGSNQRVIPPDISSHYAHVGDSVWLQAHGLFVALKAGSWSAGSSRAGGIRVGLRRPSRRNFRRPGGQSARA